jgi:predicted nucleic acid binding AN1-type Zn finger protein
MTKKLDLDHIGSHCSYKECNRLDFLPIKCDACTNLYCKEHASYLAHDCEKYDAIVEAQKKSAAILSDLSFYNCSFEECKNREMVPVVCDFCKLNFCMKHRNPEVDHKCQVFKKAQEAEQANNQRIKNQKMDAQKEFKFEMKTKVSDKNQALASKLLLMKLRQTAHGPTGLPEEFRCYCFVRYQQVEKKPFYLNTKWPVGKCVEFLFEKLSINLTSLGKIRLYLDEELVDTSLMVEEFIKMKGLSPGVVFDLK